MEKVNQIVFTQLKGTFTKDLDAFGKMDPFAIFMIGSSTAKTEVAQGAGKSPVWKTDIKLTYDDNQTEIVVKAYDQDGTQNEYIGIGIISLKTLKTESNTFYVDIATLQRQKIGEISGRYSIKIIMKEKTKKIQQEKNEDKNQILFTELKGTFTKDLDAAGKMDPFAIFTIGDCTAKTEVAEEAGKNPVWKKDIRLTYDDNQTEIMVKVYDQDATQKEYIGVGIIKLKTLKAEPSLFTVAINTLQHQKIGEISGRYSIKISKEAQEKLMKIQGEKDSAEQEKKRAKQEEEKQKQRQLQKEKEKDNQKKEKQRLKLLEDQKASQIELKNNLEKQQEQRKKKHQQLKKNEKQQKPKSLVINQQKMKPQSQVVDPIKQQKPTLPYLKKVEEKGIKPEPSKSIMQQHKPSSDNSRQIMKSSKLNTIQYLRTRRQYGDRIYNNQSSGTMQRSINVYSIPKAIRFKYEASSNQGAPIFVNELSKSTITKGAGIGFGNKKVMPQWVQRNMRQNPAPNAYFQKSQKFVARGPTFGLSHQYYQKVLIPKEKPISKQPKISPIKIKLPFIKS